MNYKFFLFFLFPLMLFGNSAGTQGMGQHELPSPQTIKTNEVESAPNKEIESAPNKEIESTKSTSAGDSTVAVDSSFVNISVSKDSVLFAFRDDMANIIDTFLTKDQKNKRVPLFMYNENYHYYCPFPWKQELRVDGFLHHPFILERYQRYQEYLPFLEEKNLAGDIFFGTTAYSMPILLSKIELSDGYSSSKMDQAVVNIKKSKILSHITAYFGFLGDRGKWLNFEKNEKSKNLYLHLKYYNKFFDISYNYFLFDRDIPVEKLLFKPIETTLDPILDENQIEAYSKEQSIIFRSAIFKAGFNYIENEYKSDPIYSLDQKTYIKSYFYALEMDFWNQNISLGYEGYDNGKSTKIDERFFSKIKLKTDYEKPFQLEGFYNEKTKSVKIEQSLWFNTSIFASFLEKENQAFDTSFVYTSDVYFFWVDKLESRKVGLEFDNKFLEGWFSYGDLDQTISENIIDSNFVTLSKKYKNSVVECDMKFKLPFSIMGQKMKFSYQTYYKASLIDSIRIYPKIQYMNTYELSFYFKYGNILHFGRKNYYFDTYFTRFGENIDNLIPYGKMVDYYAKLDLTKKFTVLFDYKNYTKEENYMGKPVYKRHFKINFLWYIFD